MKQNDNKYIFNFIIPRGPTGSQGNQGPTGPTTLEDAVFVQYHNSFTQGLLIPFSNIMVPNSSSLFSVKNDEVVINEPGNYEYTLCGNLNGNTTVSIQTIDTKGILTNLETINSITNSMLFSKTKILQAETKQRIRILFWPNETNANTGPLKFFIKRLPF